jgi:hypothetical protein
MPDFPEYTVAGRFADIKARIKSVADEYELLLAFAIAVAEAYERRTGKELRPHDEFSREDEAEAYAAVAAQSGSRA